MRAVASGSSVGDSMPTNRPSISSIRGCSPLKAESSPLMSAGLFGDLIPDLLEHRDPLGQNGILDTERHGPLVLGGGGGHPLVVASLAGQPTPAACMRSPKVASFSRQGPYAIWAVWAQASIWKALPNCPSSG